MEPQKDPPKQCNPDLKEENSRISYDLWIQIDAGWRSGSHKKVGFLID